MKVSLKKKILDKNEECALQNSTFFADNNTLCVNVISSPGSGKTTILSRTIGDLKDRLKIGVVEGDIRTDTDAKKIRSAGAAAVQIETKGTCHLSAEQVTGALGAIGAANLDIVFIEDMSYDLKDLAAEQVLLTLPMRVVCSEDCAGLCPNCGGNRNIDGACSCEPEIDPRWEALRGLEGR